MNITETDLNGLKRLIKPLKEYACVLVSIMEDVTVEEAQINMLRALRKSEEIPVPDHFTDLEKEYIELRAELMFLHRLDDVYRQQIINMY